MLLKKLGFTSIRASIFYFTCIGITLMVIMALANKYLDSQKTGNMKVERLSHAVRLQVMEIMMTEARFMQTLHPRWLEQLAPLRDGVKEAIAGIKAQTSDKNILALAQMIADVDADHAKIFEAVAFNAQRIVDDRKDVVEKLEQSNAGMNQVIEDIDQIEVQDLMDKGITLDYSLVAVRNEVKDLMRLGDQFHARVQALFLTENLESFKIWEKQAVEKMNLRMENLKTAFETVNLEQYKSAWKATQELTPQIQKLETDILSRWQKNMGLRTRLEQIQQKILEDAKEISELTKKNIRNSALVQTWVSLIVTLGGIGGLLFFGLLIARSITRPINMVVKGLKEISQGGGDLTVRLPDQDRGEMGELARSFNLFVDKQHTMIRQIAEAANALGAFTAEITVTASQLASSAAEETTTVSEVSTTTQEVKQTVIHSSENAEKVADDADSMTKVSNSGLKAVKKAVNGMNLIQEEMESVAQSIVQLSIQTKSIEEIINAVNELANQSDLLSVNASIEAAKADDFGKGFTVVAQEVKSLAEQSQQATVQIRSILREIHKAMNEAVTAAERGAKAVESGMGLSTQSGQVIQELSHSIEASVRSARQIASSCRQQLSGMEQLDMAMNTISDASKQNLDSSRRLEELTKGLNDLGIALKNQTGRFKL